jgi:hypothetical protein
MKRKPIFRIFAGKKTSRRPYRSRSLGVAARDLARPGHDLTAEKLHGVFRWIEGLSSITKAGLAFLDLGQLPAER